MKEDLAQSLLVIIPARNEEVAVGRVIQGVRDECACDIVVVDDASTDATIRAAREAGAHVIPLTVQLGSWGAAQAGMRYALRNRYERVATLDGDGQHAPSAIYYLLDHMRQSNADVVIGAFIQRGSWQRKFAWRVFQVITGLGLKDLTSGLRVYNKRAVSLLASSEATLLDYQDLGVLLLLEREGLDIQEVPCVMYPRMSGHSRIFSTWLEVLKYMVHTLLLSCSRKNDFGVKRFKSKPLIGKLQ